jgi:hypothetical protein
MNRCPSKWYFQKFLEEVVLDEGCGGESATARMRCPCRWTWSRAWSPCATDVLSTPLSTSTSTASRSATCFLLLLLQWLFIIKKQ